ncbi:MAG: translation initiation factor IF-3 [Candidatus Dojkabacteria bacterium]|nr:translation initiation factor IF-3 [Candidatus Dojkabacteria bacterium]
MKKSRFKPIKELPPVNQNIIFDEFLLLDENGKNLGKINKFSAINLAKQKNLDVFLINKNSNPPVAKLVNYEKYRYEVEKKKKQENKLKRLNSKSMKEIYFRPSIGIHDLEVKVKHLQEFLNDGYKVMVSLKFKGRENQNKKQFYKIFDIIKEKLNNYIIEKDITERERDTFMIFSPNKKVIDKHNI